MAFVPDVVESRFQPDDTEATVAGHVKEGGKGVLRGVSDTAMAAQKGAANLLFGPIWGGILSDVGEKIAAPSRELIKATPKSEGERFTGTAAEILGGAATGGGLTSGARKAGTSIAAALGGAAGEQGGGGEAGKLLGILAGAGGFNAAVSLAKSVGTNLADLGAIIGSSFLGSKSATNRLTTQAAQRYLGNDPQKIRDVAKSLERPTEYIEGTPITIGEALAETSMKGPKQVGGSLVRLQKDLTGAVGVEDELPNVLKAQKAGLQVHLKDIEKAAAPFREDTARSVRAAGGINPYLVADIVDTKLSKAGVRQTDVQAKVLEDVKKRILNLPGAKSSTIPRVSFEDLYVTRKQLGNIIHQHSKDSASWDKQMAAGLERELQRSIDQAIVMSGGRNWRKYMAIESTGHQQARDQLARQAEAKRIAAATKGQPISELVPGELPKPPTLLSRKMMAANFVLRMLEKDANTPVVKEMTKRLKDPKAFAELLKKPMGSPDRDALEFVLNALKTSGRISATVDFENPSAIQAEMLKALGVE